MQLMRLKTTKMLTTNNDLNNLSTRVQFSSRGTQTSQNSHDDPDMPMTQARMGKMVPNFVAETTQGEIDFHKWLGNSWGILFSHPAPFTPICTTEMGAMAAEYEEFKKRNCKLLGVSCESVNFLKAWADDIKSFNGLKNFSINLLADQDRMVAHLYGLIEPTYRDNFSGIPYPCRGLFIIDPEKTLKMMSFHPWSMGRNTSEILRTIDSLQLTRQYNNKVCTPADWALEKPVMIDTSTTSDDINEMFRQGVVTHFVPSKKDYMRTVGKLTPEYVVKQPDKTTEKRREIQTEKTKRKISVETRQSSTHAVPVAKIREAPGPRAIFPRHIFAASVTEYSPIKTGITREKKFPLVLNKEATTKNTVEDEFDPFKL